MHLGMRLGMHCKTKRIDWVCVWVCTFNIHISVFAPLTMTKKRVFGAFLGVFTPPLFRRQGA
jgi:hypothetical protein